MTRNVIQVLFVTAVFFGSLIGTIAEKERLDYELRGYVDATSTLELPYRLPRLGVNADLTIYSPEQLNDQLGLMQQAGIHWIRQEILWDELEPTQGEFRWHIYDYIIDTLSRHPEFELVIVIKHTPSWTRTKKSSSTTAPPDDLADFENITTLLAQRYGSKVDYYQIWDEPNIALGWGEALPNPTHYMALLETAYKAIHSHDLDATILAAALAPTVESGPQNINEVRFLQDLYVLGLGDYSDAIAAKPYGFDVPPDDRTVDIDTMNFSRIILLREVMVENDDARTPLWASQWGWNSLPSDWHHEPSIWGQVDQANQINYTIGAIERAEREWPWLGGMILHHWNQTQSANDPQIGFALVDQNGEPNALWHAIVQSRDQDQSASNGLYPAQNPYTMYSGIWTLSDYGADMGWVQDSGLKFRFSGTDVALILRQGDYVAYFYPTLDHASPNALPRDNKGNYFVSAQSADLRPVLSSVPVARGLPLDTYELQLTAVELIPGESEHRWPLVGFSVSSGDLAIPYHQQIAIGAITTLISFVALIYSILQLTSKPQEWFHRFAFMLLGQVWQLVLAIATSLVLMIGMYLTWNTESPVILKRDPIPLTLSILTSGLIYINEWGIIVAAFSALALFMIILNRIEIGLALVVFWLPFFLFPVELYRFSFPIAELILFITLSAWVVTTAQRYIEYPGKRQLSPLLKHFYALDWLMLGWVLVGLVSLLWAQFPATALTDIRQTVIEPALFYIIVRTTLTIDHLRLMLNMWLLSAIVVALIGIIMWLQGDGITAEGGTLRLVSTYGSPNNVALYLGRVIPFALIFGIALDDNRDRRLIILGGAFIIVALVLTQSAGGMFIGAPISIAIVLILQFRSRALVPIILGGIVLVFLGICLASATDRFERLVDFTRGTNFYRLRVWESSLEIIADKPVTGLGMDQFLYAFHDRYMMPDAWEEPDLSHPHNFILDWWIRLGIMGLVVFGLIQCYFWKTTFRLWERLKSDSYPALINIGIMASMMNLLAHGFVDNSVFVFDLAHIFALLVGIGVVIQNTSAIDPAPEKVM